MDDMIVILVNLVKRTLVSRFHPRRGSLQQQIDAFRELSSSLARDDVPAGA